MASVRSSLTSRHRRFDRLATVAAPFLATALIISSGACKTQLGPDGNFDPAAFTTPPAANRPYVRWWWPGGAVDDAEVGRELSVLQNAGFGGVEIQPLDLGLTPAEVAADPAIRTVGTASYFAHVRAALQKAKALGMGVDLTFGSGWPTGGPSVSTGAERQLLMSSVQVTGPATFSGPLPAAEPPDYIGQVNGIMNCLGSFDANTKLVAVTAARLEDASVSPQVVSSFTVLGGANGGGALPWQVPPGAWVLTAFYENYTNHDVIGGAWSGTDEQSLVIDHLDPSGVNQFAKGFGEPLSNALGPDAASLGALFVDSPELIGQLPWTPAFRDRFQQEKGYDLTPYLSLVFKRDGEAKYTSMFGDTGPTWTSVGLGDRVREDYEDVRGLLFRDGLINPIASWVHGKGRQLRFQSHGGFYDLLDGYALADIPESEGLYAGGTFDFLKLAASAAHVGGKSIVSSETYVSDAPTGARVMTNGDFYGLAGRALSAGVTRIMHHGYPYRRTVSTGERWFPFSARQGTIGTGPFPITSWSDEDNGNWKEFPALNAYVARIGYAMSRGQPSTDVAVLEQNWNMPDGVFLNVGGFVPHEGESAMSQALGSAGLSWDWVSRSTLTNATVSKGALHVGSASYRALILHELQSATPEMLSAIDRIQQAGLPVVRLGALPARGFGYAHHEQQDAQVKALSESLTPRLPLVTGPQLGSALASVVPIVHASDGKPMQFTEIRRDLPHQGLVFLFNEGDRSVTQSLTIEKAKAARVLDAGTGEGQAPVSGAGGRVVMSVTVPSRRGVVVQVQR